MTPSLTKKCLFLFKLYFMKTFTKELQVKTSPDAAIEILKQGNKRFVDKENAQRLLLKAFAEEVIEKIKDDTLRARVSAILDDNLNR